MCWIPDWSCWSWSHAAAASSDFVERAPKCRYSNQKSLEFLFLTSPWSSCQKIAAHPKSSLSGPSANSIKKAARWGFDGKKINQKGKYKTALDIFLVNKRTMVPACSYAQAPQAIQKSHLRFIVFGRHPNFFGRWAKIRIARILSRSDHPGLKTNSIIGADHRPPGLTTGPSVHGRRQCCMRIIIYCLLVTIMCQLRQPETT